MNTYRIKIEHAEPGMILAEPVYLSMGMMISPGNTKLTDILIARMAEKDVQSVVVNSNVSLAHIAIDAEEKSKSASEPAGAPENKPAPKPSDAPANISPDAPPCAILDKKLKEEAVAGVKELFSCFSCEVVNKTTAYKCVRNIESVVQDLIEVISADPDSLVHINDLKSYDDYTYHHSLSVSLLAMATGRKLGMSDDELFRLGRCAMMHDIGKSAVSSDIINKKGLLTDDERRAVQEHPVLGAALLKDNDVGDEELWHSIRHHHEKVDGTGYPDKLKGDEIPLFCKIIAVADVYDALTSFRSYRDPNLPDDAYDRIFEDRDKFFDCKVLQALFDKLVFYPNGTVVQLSDNRSATVIDGGTSQRRRPVIRINDSGEIIRLVDNPNLKIVAIEATSENPEKNQ
ncbi:MAG: HD-GYP domain-containing protein [Defluviitaleaceae bacterium]|nr:HD-GYP domain-containing protein [Defluviitaleaceae bacterium]